MAATLITVAAIASLMMKRENDCCWLKAMRRAIKMATFNRHDFSDQKRVPFGASISLGASKSIEGIHRNESFLHFCLNIVGYSKNHPNAQSAAHALFSVCLLPAEPCREIPGTGVHLFG